MEPITRTEQFLARAAGNSGEDLTPITRQEHFLKAIADAQDEGGGSVSSVNGKTGEVVLTAADLDDSFKDALLDCFANVAWSTEGGQQYYDALEAALYPIDHITAVYTQSGTVYDTDSLDSLKADLVVTAFYQGGGSKVVATYTLSGTLTVGTSTITVSYGGKTAAFNVAVTDGSGRPWKTIALADLFGGGLQAIYNSTTGVYGDTERKDSRTSYPNFDIFVSSDYKYTFQFDGASANIGVPYFSNGVLEAVAAHQNITSYLTDPGWKTRGYTFTPPSNTVCLRITFDKSKTTLENGGFTALNIFREAATE